MHNKYLIQAETQASDVFIWAVKYLNAMLLSCWCTWMTYFFMSTKGEKKRPQGLQTDCLPEPRRVKRDEQNFCGHVELFLLMH